MTNPKPESDSELVFRLSVGPHSIQERVLPAMALIVENLLLTLGVRGEILGRVGRYIKAKSQTKGVWLLSAHHSWVVLSVQPLQKTFSCFRYEIRVPWPANMPQFPTMQDFVAALNDTIPVFNERLLRSTTGTPVLVDGYQSISPESPLPVHSPADEVSTLGQQVYDLQSLQKADQDEQKHIEAEIAAIRLGKSLGDLGQLYTRRSQLIARISSRQSQLFRVRARLKALQDAKFAADTLNSRLDEIERVISVLLPYSAEVEILINRLQSHLRSPSS